MQSDLFLNLLILVFDVRYSVDIDMVYIGCLDVSIVDANCSFLITSNNDIFALLPNFLDIFREIEVHNCRQSPLWVGVVLRSVNWQKLISSHLLM